MADMAEPERSTVTTWHTYYDEARRSLVVSRLRTQFTRSPGRKRWVDGARTVDREFMLLTLEEWRELSRSVEEHLDGWVRDVTSAGVRIDPQTDKVIFPTSSEA